MKNVHEVAAALSMEPVMEAGYAVYDISEDCFVTINLVDSPRSDRWEGRLSDPACLLFTRVALLVRVREVINIHIAELHVGQHAVSPLSFEHTSDLIFRTPVSTCRNPIATKQLSHSH